MGLPFRVLVAASLSATAWSCGDSFVTGGASATNGAGGTGTATSSPASSGAGAQGGTASSSSGVGGAGGTNGSWSMPGWQYRREITLLSSVVEAPSGGVLIDFPFLINLPPDQSLADNVASGAADLRFTSATGELLDRDVETRRADGRIWVWVRIPQLSSTVDTAIHMYYGNPAATAPNSEPTWGSSFEAVYHLDDQPAGLADMDDATSHNRHCDAEASMPDTADAIAKVHQGIEFDGIDDYIDCASFDVGQTFTISAWIYLDPKNNIQTIFSNAAAGPADGFRLFVNNYNTSDGRLILETENAALTSDRAETAVNVVTTLTFHHVVAAVDREAGTAQLYLDGNDVTSDGTVRTDFATASDYEIGRMESNEFHVDGKIDELRVSNVVRSPEWLKTCFNNQNDPGASYTVGPEEQAP